MVLQNEFVDISGRVNEPVVAYMEVLTIQMNAIRFIEVLNTCRIELQRTKSFDPLMDLATLLQIH